MSVENMQQLISPLFNERVVKEILQKSSGLQDVIVDDIIAEDSVQKKGYSFISNVVKLRIEGTGKESAENYKKVYCDIFVKIQPRNIGRCKSFRTSDFFRNEVIFYNDVWSTLMKFQDEKNVKNKFNNIPICFSAECDGVNDYIALEDLNIQNYVLFNKRKEMDYECVILIIRLLARFHALSFAFKDQFPKEFERLANVIEETYFHEKFRDWFKDFHRESVLKVARDAIEKELPSSYLKKFDELVANDLYGKICKICANKEDKLSVITQGDVWMANFLVKYGENNKLVDIKMIDFQIVRCCPPSCDISFFLYCCTSYELYNTHWDDIMKEYHSTFTEFLAELGSNPEIFKYEDFVAEMKANALLGCCMAMEGIPNQQAEEEETSDLDQIQGTEAVSIGSVWKLYPMKKKGRMMLANVFKHSVDNGFI